MNKNKARVNYLTSRSEYRDDLALRQGQIDIGDHQVVTRDLWGHVPLFCVG